MVHILRVNPLPLFCHCACHSLNLRGSHVVECCQQIQTFFGIIQKLYNLYSSSPIRWKILTENIGCSIHSLLHTSWSDRVDSVKPFSAHIPSLRA